MGPLLFKKRNACTSCGGPICTYIIIYIEIMNVCSAAGLQQRVKKCSKSKRSLRSALRTERIENITLKSSVRRFSQGSTRTHDLIFIIQ